MKTQAPVIDRRQFVQTLGMGTMGLMLFNVD